MDGNGRCPRSLSRRLLAASALVTTTMALTPTVVLAQAEPAKQDNGIEEIVVTATRQVQALSRVPVSVSAITGTRLEEKGIKSAADLERFVPGLKFSAGTNTIAIRGISSGSGAATTGVYIDDTPIQLIGIGTAISNNTVPAIFDLERVEVLRGPQGTLFGAGAEGGVVRYITPAPSLTNYSARGRAELGFVQGGSRDFEVGVAGGGPIIEDKVGIRMSFYSREIAGWVDRYDNQKNTVVQPNFNGGDVKNFRFAAAIAPTDRLMITPSVVYQYRFTNSNGASSFNRTLSNPDEGRFLNSDPQAVPDTDRWVMPAVKLEYDFGKAKLISNTSFFYRQERGGYSGLGYTIRILNSYSAQFLPGIPRPLATDTGLRIPNANYYNYATLKSKQNNFSEELRLQSNDPDSRLTWVVGMYLQQNRGRNIERIVDPAADMIFTTLFGRTMQQFSGFGFVGYKGQDTFFADFLTHDNQVAGFGEATLAITDKLKATGGLRYASTKFDFANSQDGFYNGGPSAGGGVQKEKPFTPKISLAYQADSQNMVYATAAKGYRIGGANAPIPLLTCAAELQRLGIAGAPAGYGSDSTWSYELGSKNRLGPVQVAASAYYIKWKNIQQRSSINCGFAYIDNLGEATSKGFDLQAQGRIADGLIFDLAVGYTDAAFSKTVKTPAGAILVNNGNVLPGAPWTVSAGLQYAFIAAGRDTYVRLDYQYASQLRGLTTGLDSTVSGFNALNQFRPPSTSYFQFRTGMNVGKADVQIWVDNLLNSNKILSQGNTRNWPIFTQTTWRPRTISFAVTYNY